MCFLPLRELIVQNTKMFVNVPISVKKIIIFCMDPLSMYAYTCVYRCKN